ncbi:peptidase domain-containing ABC transporter [Pseudomonas chlororaphis]|uniref:ABC transporter n=1 Tax=Pseudomonas chlororaphis TaxID=587753 RepID=A0A1Q8ENP2_9PSED|nr:peptidase domain-containing ABC transporter [Pseudomonas chlororaphis]OLF53420.1 ABC transporter [Pseudomonas chlororaphis]
MIDLLDKLRGFGHKRLPMMLQAQMAECGLACLAMIACYHGADTDLAALRRRFMPSVRGATLNEIVGYADQLGLGARALRLELDELERLSLPCILHWEMNHFVVLKHVARDHVVIHDPAHGVRRLTFEQLSPCFTGIALELCPVPSFTPRHDKPNVSLTKLIGKVDRIGQALGLTLALSLAIETAGILAPLYLQWVVDQVLVSADVDLLSLLALGFLLLTLFRDLFDGLRAWALTWFSGQLNVQWSASVFARLLKLPMTYFEQRHVGDVVSRFNAIHEIQHTLTSRFVGTLLDGALAVVTLAVLFAYQTTLAWLVIATFVIYGLVRYLAFRPLRGAQEEYLVHAARAETLLLESIRGVRALKIANQQERRTHGYTNALVDATNRHVKVQRLSICFSSFQHLLIGLSRVLLIWAAARQVLDGEFSAGMLMAFVSYADQFMTRASGLVDALIEFRMLRLHGERLADIVLAEVEPGLATAPPPARPAQAPPPSVTVEGLRYRYADSEPWILDGCAFAIAPGESVALVGASGQGKSTLIKLLLGLVSPQEGRVLIDGIDLRTIGPRAYRDMIGCVMQDDILFAGTIEDNISFFATEPDRGRVVEVAQLAQIHSDISAMPMGYRTLVGDMGDALSGGQRQRVLLARALYRQPSILVLDEATSHLDADCEQRVNDAIRQLPITRIVVAHRAQTIRSADRVIEIECGKAHDASAATTNLRAEEAREHLRPDWPAEAEASANGRPPLPQE